jgi:hypothetical protein
MSSQVSKIMNKLFDSCGVYDICNQISMAQYDDFALSSDIYRPIRGDFKLFPVNFESLQQLSVTKVLIINSAGPDIAN